MSGTVVTVSASEVRQGDRFIGFAGRARIGKPVHAVHRTERFVYLHLPRTTVQFAPDRPVAVERAASSQGKDGAL